MSDDIRFFRNRTEFGYGLLHDPNSKSRKYMVSKGLRKKDIHITIKKVWRPRFDVNFKKIYVKSLLYDHGVGGII